MVIFNLGEESQTLATELAGKTGLALSVDEPVGYYLVFKGQRLCVRDSRQGKNFVLKIEVSSELKKMKDQKLNYKKDLFCRAVGFKGDSSYSVFDGTLGFGKDAFHLISAGCKVIGCEQNLVVFSLFEDALKHEQHLCPTLSIIHGNTLNQLSQYVNSIDCVYLDPMFENIKKKSAPKKSIAFLRELNPKQDDIEPVIARAIELGVKRVVVKRPINGDHLYRKPNVTFNGKLIRYDVYIR